MFRTKVGAALAVVFVIVTAIVYVQLEGHLSEQTTMAVENRLKVARASVKRVRRLRDFALVAKAEEVARHSPIGAALDKKPAAFADAEGNLPTDDDYRYEIHRLMNAELAVWKKRFEELAAGKESSDGLSDYRREKPDLFWVVDAGGIGVAKHNDLAWFGPQQANVGKQFPTIGAAIKSGQTTKDLWIYSSSPMDVVVAPVKHQGATVGAVVMGYRFTDAEAKKDGGLVNSEVAYFIGERLSQTSTLPTGAERALQAWVAAEKPWENKEDDGRTLLEFELQGRNYVGYLGMLEGNASVSNAGFLVFADLGGALSSATEVMLAVPLLGILGFFLSFGLVMVFFREHLQPLEEIDRGVLEIVNGNLDYWFEARGEKKELPDTMSQNLNIMVCQLSGRPLPEDDDAPESEHWAEDRMFIDELDPSEFTAQPVDSSQVPDQPANGVPATADSTMGYAPDILRLVREDADSYHRRLFREYTEACRQTGEPVQGISFEKFVSKLEGNAAALRDKYDCSSVRFLVVIRDGKVSMKPVPIV